jgi:hypothetical protein
MAERTIHITRDEVPAVGGEAGKFGISDSDISIPTSSRRRDAPSQPTSNSRRNSAQQRSTLSVEDRRDENQEVGSGVPTSKTTPSPNRVSKRQSLTHPIFMSATEAKQNANYLVSALEMVGVVTAGPIGEMTPFERGILIPPTQRMLERTPVQIVGKFTPLIDGAAIIIGMGMYIMRVSSGVKGSPKNPVQQTQEDVAAPVMAQPASTVSNVKAGDLDGIAPPVPTQIRDILNGSI